MFESVVPEVVARPSRRLLYETLPVSLVVHAAAIGGVLVSSIWNVALPEQSPKMMVAYSLTRLPDPPPPPPPPTPVAQPAAQVLKSQVLPKPAAAPALGQIVAPTVIPDLIPQVVEAPPAPPVPVEAPAVVENAPHAVAGGDVKGKGTDLLGKTFGVNGGIVFAEDGRVHVDRSVKLPLKEIEMVYPTYPDAAKKDRLEDKCVIRYTIGTNGRVVDVAIIEHSQHEMFETESLRVIRQWRFRPMMVSGKPVEVVHEVEFFYQFTQR